MKGKDKYAVVDNPLTQSTQSFTVTMLAYSNILAAQLFLVLLPLAVNHFLNDGAGSTLFGKRLNEVVSLLEHLSWQLVGGVVSI